MFVLFSSFAWKWDELFFYICTVNQYPFKMEAAVRDKFMALWNTYFPGAELPVTFQYTDDDRGLPVVAASEGHRCIISQLIKARRGETLCMQVTSVCCRGGRRYVGFADKMFPGFESFLSHDESGEGERYKQSPQLAAESLAQLPILPLKGRNLIFKRWDHLDGTDNPEAVIFFASADVISGLFTLACFDNSAPDAVITPFGAGCTSIIYHPYREQLMGTNRAILGMFDPSARKCLKKDLLSFAVPMNKFRKIIDEMEESFLITPTWSVIRKRME